MICGVKGAAAESQMPRCTKSYLKVPSCWPMKPAIMQKSVVFRLKWGRALDWKPKNPGELPNSAVGWDLPIFQGCDRNNMRGVCKFESELNH